MAIFFLYDRSGKALRKINRKGQGPEEYTYLSKVILDEDKSEMHVYSFSTKKNIVYDLYGIFKRSFDINKDGGNINIYNYDKENFIHDELILNFNDDNTIEEKNAESFYIVSKQDGSVVREIKIPFIKEKSPTIVKKRRRNDYGFYLIKNDKIAMYAKFEAFELIEANEQGKLKGKLKEIADGLDDDDNPVVMLVKIKK